MLELPLRSKQMQYLIHEVDVAVVDPENQPELFHMVDVLVEN
jgi:hypothetical protein